MKDGLGNIILKGVIFVILFVVALKILKWALSILVPIAIVVIAAYIVYNLVFKKRW
ncbi:MAG: hypothetical protein N3B21_15750 [Clostridia bacterium]|nr:hypothetical protein [Clostridia bacterium]